MKVVFLEDVANVAQAGEVKEVADGYGRNFLLPRKLAMLADSKATNVLEVQLKKRARIQAQIEGEMKELAQQLEGKEFVLKARAGASDRLYGSITSADIAEEINNSAGLVVDKKKIELEEPIRQVGSYEIAIRLTKDIMPKIKLTVAEEKKEEDKKKEEDNKKEEGKRKKRTKVKETEVKVEEAEVKVEEAEVKAEEDKQKEEGKRKKRTKAKETGVKTEEAEVKVEEAEKQEESEETE